MVMNCLSDREPSLGKILNGHSHSKGEKCRSNGDLVERRHVDEGQLVLTSIQGEAANAQGSEDAAGLLSNTGEKDVSMKRTFIQAGGRSSFGL